MKAIFVLAALAVATPAIAAEDKPAAEQQVQAGGEGAQKERKICKRQETSSGLYGTRRVCLTAEQWRQRNRNQEDGDLGSVTTR